jgi:hypothetical protein
MKIIQRLHRFSVNKIRHLMRLLLLFPHPLWEETGSQLLVGGKRCCVLKVSREYKIILCEKFYDISL